MKKIFAVIAFLALTTTVSAQTLLYGTVCDTTGALLSGVIVYPIKYPALRDTTDVNGIFSISDYITGARAHNGGTGREFISCVNGMVKFAVNARERVDIKVFNLSGKEIAHPFDRFVDAGAYRVSLASLCASQVLLVRVCCNQQVMTFKLFGMSNVSFGSGNAIASGIAQSKAASQKAILANDPAIDTLLFSLPGYVLSRVPISSYVTADSIRDTLRHPDSCTVRTFAYGGNVTLYPSRTKYPYGAIVKARETPAAGYFFEGWIINDDVTDAPVTPMVIGGDSVVIRVTNNIDIHAYLVNPWDTVNRDSSHVLVEGSQCIVDDAPYCIGGGGPALIGDPIINPNADTNETMRYNVEGLGAHGPYAMLIDVTLQNMSKVTYHHVCVQILSVVGPGSGFESCNSDPFLYSLSQSPGYWYYGDLAPGAKATRQWRFLDGTLPQLVFHYNIVETNGGSIGFYENGIGDGWSATIQNVYCGSFGDSLIVQAYFNPVDSNNNIYVLVDDKNLSTGWTDLSGDIGLGWGSFGLSNRAGLNVDFSCAGWRDASSVYHFGVAKRLAGSTATDVSSSVIAYNNPARNAGGFYGWTIPYSAIGASPGDSVRVYILYGKDVASGGIHSAAPVMSDAQITKMDSSVAPGLTDIDSIAPAFFLK